RTVIYDDVAGAGTGLTFSSFAATVGQIVVVALRWEGGGSSDSATASISDSAGTTYNVIAYRTTNSSSEDNRVALAWGRITSAHASNVISVTLSATRNWRVGVACIYDVP